MTGLPSIVRLLIIIIPIISAPYHPALFPPLYLRLGTIVVGFVFLFYNWLIDYIESKKSIKYNIVYLRYGADLSLFTLFVRYAEVYKACLFYSFLALIFCWSATLLYHLRKTDKFSLLNCLILSCFNLIFYIIGAAPIENLLMIQVDLGAVVMTTLIGGYFGNKLADTVREREKREQKELGSLYKISRILGLSLSFDTMISLIREELKKLISAKEVKVALIEKESFLILPKKEEKIELKNKDKETLLLRKEPVMLKGEETEFLFPLVIENKVLGLLSIILEEKRDLSLSEKKFIYTLSSDLAISLSNCLLICALKENNKRILEEFHRLIELREPYCRGHTEKVLKLVKKMADKLELPEEKKNALKLAALLHDIGKIGVPEKILLKNDKLTEEEYQTVKKYPLIGLELLSNLESLGDVLPIIYHHRERYDGKGYIEGKGNEDIPIEARILGLVEAFCAMQELRPWRPPLSEEAAVKLIKEEKGGAFDPKLVDILLSIYKNE